MKERPYAPFWPARLPFQLDYPQVPLFRFLSTSAEYHPNKTAITYYGREITYEQVWSQVESLAGSLAKRGVGKGDRVAIYLQNSPQFAISFFAIQRANAVVIPANPMLSGPELSFILSDSGAQTLITTHELLPRVQKAREEVHLPTVIAGSLADYLPSGEPSLEVPEFMHQGAPEAPDTEAWNDVLAEGHPPPEVEVGPGDLCLLPYTSGSTGKPKGCMHTHATVMSNVVSAYHWNTLSASSVHLCTLPFFHVTGLVHSLLAPLMAGGNLVLLTRWDRETALQAIEKYGCTHWMNISTMVVDIVNDPHISERDLSSLALVGGGGAPLPEAVGRRLKELTGLTYCEGYGLTETISQTHMNPPDRPKLQCIGIPDFGVDARILDLETLQELPYNQSGELVISGPEVCLGYWNRPEDNEESFIEMEGKTFFRTGDICYMDEEGYFFLVDRTKRMINAAGFKVWPAEVEASLYKNPAIKEACVVGVPDPKKGEEVRAYIVLSEDYAQTTTDQDIIDWAKEQMAAYKYPRQVVFVEQLPKSGTGKIMWRELQEQAQKEMQGDK